MDLKKYTVAELLETHTAVLNELRDREILRTANNPTGDYAEWLFCEAFGWDQAANSVKGFDATDAEGIRYQIKGRGCTSSTHQGNCRPFETWTGLTCWRVSCSMLPLSSRARR